MRRGALRGDISDVPGVGTLRTVRAVDLASVAVELLDRLPANRTLGLPVTEVLDGFGRATLPVSNGVENVIGARPCPAQLSASRARRGAARATCELDADTRAALARLFTGRDEQARFTTLSVIDGDGSPRAAEGEFD